MFLHINGTDIHSHDRDREGKTEFIEKVDLEIGKILAYIDIDDACRAVTCDHRTVRIPEHRGYEHVRDPVPIVIAGDGIKPDQVKKFDEDSAKTGSLKLSGTELIRLLLILTNRA